uniref:Uncharacterized protein n=1 Tax=Strigamia maritima TaxID=126957 RepID=T1ITM0_STRMM
MGKRKNKRKFDSIQQDLPAAKTAKLDENDEKTEDNQIIANPGSSIPLPLQEEITSIYSQLKLLFFTNSYNIKCHLVDRVEFYLEKSDFSYRWCPDRPVRRKKIRPFNHKYQLYVEEFLISQGKTKHAACIELLGILKTHDTHLYFLREKYSCIKVMMSLEKAPKSKILKLLPSLIEFKTAFDEYDKESDDIIGKVFATIKSTGLRIECLQSHDSLRKCMVCAIVLIDFFVCEGTAETREGARKGARLNAFEKFIIEVDKLIEKGKKIDEGNIMDEVLVDPILFRSEFVLFESPNLDNSISILNNSAKLNDVDFKLKASDGICSVFFGKVFILSVRGDEDDPTRTACELAVQRLKRKCHTVVIKKNFPDINIARSDVLTEAENIDESKVNLSRIEEVFNDILSSFKIQSVVFSSDFSISEKESILSCAKALKLEIESSSPSITVKRRIQAESLVKFLADAGGSTDDYELISPTEKKKKKKKKKNPK